MFSLAMHSARSNYGYVAVSTWLGTTYDERGDPLPPRHGYSFRTVASDFLYAPFHKQNITYSALCYTSCGALAGMRESLVGPLLGIDPTKHRITDALSRSYERQTDKNGNKVINELINVRMN